MSDASVSTGMSEMAVEQMSFVEGMTDGMVAKEENKKPSFPAGEPRKMDSIDGYRIVPDAIFPSTKDYLFTIDTRKSYANTACVKFFPDAEYVQYLINAEKRMFALVPCEPTAHHSFRWSKEKNGKKTPRNRCGKDFAILISTLMGWNPNDRFQFRGTPVPVMINGKEELVLSFDLEYNRPYERKKTEDGKERIVPADMSWLDKLGPLYTEQTRSLKINSINGYNVISTTEKPRKEQTQAVTESQSDVALQAGEATKAENEAGNTGMDVQNSDDAEAEDLTNSVAKQDADDAQTDKQITNLGMIDEDVDRAAERGGNADGLRYEAG